jgi:hypothetical protein
MKKRAYSAIAMMIGTLLTPQYSFAYDDYDARSVCTNKVTGHGSDYKNPHDVYVNKTGHHSYAVEGKVDGRHDKDNKFTCRIEHKEVVSWNVSVSHDRDKNDKSNKKLAIGAGVLGLAAIAAMVVSNKSSNANNATTTEDKATQEKQNAYSTGNSSPFEDLDFLKNACKHMLSLHLEEDHGQLDNLELKSANLDGRVLSGDGKIKFQNHERHKLEYQCHFDRSGNIYDGSYKYTD